MISHKIAYAVAKSFNYKMKKISRNLTENRSETVESETEIPKEIYIYIYIYIYIPEKNQKVIDDLRLINTII